MNKQPKVRYDYNYLQQHCKEHNIELLEDYSNVNINIYTNIRGRCVNTSCNNIFSKGMKQL